jgi:hypothetical protein
MFAHFSDDLDMEILKCMASSIQTVIQNVFCERIHSSVDDDQIKTIALNKLVKAGFYKSSNDVPSSLAKVRNEMIKMSSRGGGSTLGADLLVLCADCSEEELQKLHDSEPSVIPFIADLLNKRGGGNASRYSLSRDDLETLKMDVYKSIAIIKEVF